MDRFIDREGNETQGIDPISIRDNVKLKEKFDIVIYKYEDKYCRDEELEIAGIERFDSYPNKNQILWAIKKHNGQSAEVHKIYFTEDIPF